MPSGKQLNYVGGGVGGGGGHAQGGAPGVGGAVAGQWPGLPGGNPASLFIMDEEVWGQVSDGAALAPLPPPPPLTQSPPLTHEEVWGQVSD